jgi:hypothetical protein
LEDSYLYPNWVEVTESNKQLGMVVHTLTPPMWTEGRRVDVCSQHWEKARETLY